LSQLAALPLEDKYVMIGDSLIENGQWSEWLDSGEIANRGVSGDSSIQMLDRLRSYSLNRVLGVIGMIGINDILNGKPAVAVTDAVDNAISYIHSREIPVLWISILPVAPPRLNCNEEIATTNRLIKNVCRQCGAEFLDINEHFTELGVLSGELSLDGLHLNGRGYALLSDSLRRSVLLQNLPTSCN